MRLLLLLIAFVIGCASDNERPDAGPHKDAASHDTGTRDSGAPDAGEPEVEQYCELTVDFFCSYYLRCGRMAVADLAECRRVFLETCNTVYEPRYRALADRGMIELSAAGIAACRAHLERVDCAQQIRDLDGDCAGLWIGTQPAGASCGFDVATFVCDEASTCALRLDLCGTCKTELQVDDPCGAGVEGSCESGAECSSGKCIARIAVGEACDANSPSCVLGATCDGNQCAGPEIVPVGSPCDRGHRCQYRADCVGGFCVEAALNGASCSSEPCASGYCNPNSARCVALLPDGEQCSESAECASQSCNTVCGAFAAACF